MSPGLHSPVEAPPAPNEAVEGLNNGKVKISEADSSGPEVVRPVEEAPSRDKADPQTSPEGGDTPTAKPVAWEKVADWLQQAVTTINRLGEIPECVDELRGLLENASKEINPPKSEIRKPTPKKKGSLPDTETTEADTEPESDAESESGSSDSEKLILIPELRYVPWRKAAETREESMLYPDQEELTYHTIDVPANEPDVADLEFMFLNGWQAPEHQVIKGQLSRPEYLPERIRINSRKFRSFLDEEFCHQSLKYTGNSCFSILRPFKMLVYLDKKLRARVEEMSRTLEALEEAPAKDDVRRDVSNGSWRWRGDEEDSVSLARCVKDCRCLLQFIDQFLIPEQQRLAAGPDEVRFADICFLFPRGSLIYVKDSKVPHKVWKVIQATGGRHFLSKPDHMQGEYRPSSSPLVLDCFFLDYDGDRFVPVYRMFQIAEFVGVQSVKLLPILPFAVAEREPCIVDRQALLARGRQFVECTTKVSHLEYSGRSQYLSPNGTKLVEMVDLEAPNARSALCYSERLDSEVVIDFDRALQAVPGWRPERTELTLYEIDGAETAQEGVDKDAQWDRKMSEEFMEEETRKLHAWEFGGTVPSKDDDLLLLPDRVFGFVLSSRQWACLKLGKGPDGKEQLRERVKKDNPWERLQLPRGHKELVQSLITSHFARTQSQTVHFDLLKNKGNGVIILLHGVPGVGKTSTAECVAISNDKPLLPITCGDLGLTPREVEDKLKEVFRLAQDWGCIMLLDEADVFLAQRSLTDTNRNALVSVFLRTLEYYEGILFLTTNRVGVFDEAFKSRIHMALYYPPLSSSQTVRIWQRHIEQASQSNIHVDPDDLLDFADQIYQTQSKAESSSVWNGRQIRNAFQSAVALAAFNSNGGPIRLDRKYFEDVFQVSDQFSVYVWTTKNYQTDADRHRIAMTRRDNFEYNPLSTQEITLQAQLQQQKQHGAYLSTYAQDIPRSVADLGPQIPPQGGSRRSPSPFPAHAHRLDDMQAAAMRQGANTPSDIGGRHFAPETQGQVNPNTANMLQSQQQSQYTTQGSNFGSGQQVRPPTDQTMFGASYGSSMSGRH